MTRHVYSIQPAAEEFDTAVRWYEDIRRGLGAEFYDAVCSTIALIAEQPEIGPVVEGARSTRGSWSVGSHIRLSTISHKPTS